MKYVENIRELGELRPDYLGFIFYDKSSRNFEGVIPELPKTIKKTGVFVNELIEIVVSLAQAYNLEALQLHGDETLAYIASLKEHLPHVEIIKVFGIKDDFDFAQLAEYESSVDYFLFDTKGKERGGNGIKFDWTVLQSYPYSKPFFLSGGIGPDDADQIQAVFASKLPVYGIDINSRFEREPGLKIIKEVKDFKHKLQTL